MTAHQSDAIVSLNSLFASWVLSLTQVAANGPSVTSASPTRISEINLPQRRCTRLALSKCTFVEPIPLLVSQPIDGSENLEGIHHSRKTIWIPSQLLRWYLKTHMLMFVTSWTNWYVTQMMTPSKMMTLYLYSLSHLPALPHNDVSHLPVYSHMQNKQVLIV